MPNHVLQYTLPSELTDILPSELTDIIVQYKKQADSKDIIKRWTNIMIIKTAALKFVIPVVLDSFNTSEGLFYLADHPISLHGKSMNFNYLFLGNLMNILNYNYSREKYVVKFWKSLLNMLGCCLYNHHKYLVVSTPTKKKLKKNENYVLLQQTIKTWFHLCKKHNIELFVAKYNKKFIDYNHEKTRDYESYTDFHEHTQPPIISFTKCSVATMLRYGNLEYQHCYNYLKWYYNTININ